MFTTRTSRRSFLKSSGAALLTAFPVGQGFAQKPAKWQRVNVSDPKRGPQVIDSYKRAIRKMLSLPPEDPRNWYRLVLAHTLDCPHGNWWFLPWHRGYLGWFEQICRDLSGDPAFALPYWDWTTEPEMPAVLFDDILDPNNPAFISRGADFQLRFRNAIQNASYWQIAWGNNEDPMRYQYGQLLARQIRFPDDLWFDVLTNPTGPFFFDQPGTRGLTKQNRKFDKTTAKAVSPATIQAALSPIDFITFGSSKASNHSAASGSGVLEGQPHNLVHNYIGAPYGFMQAFMSPVDPIFYLHHANIDRLWDVWTRRQRLLKYPAAPAGEELKSTLPDDRKSDEEKNSDYYKWAREPFLFFVDANGKAVTKTRCGDYIDIGEFDYEYTAAFGEQFVRGQSDVGASKLFKDIFGSSVIEKTVTHRSAARADVKIAPGLASAIERNAALFAKITLDLPPLTHGIYKVIVNGPANATDIGPESPFYAGTLSMFGHMVMQGSFTFTVPISEPVSYLRMNKLLPPGQAISIRVLPVTETAQPQIMAMHIPQEPVKRGEVLEVTIEAHRPRD